VLERIAPRVPLAGHEDLETTALAALRCPECTSGLDVADHNLLRCGS
jgi:hypothetical protein